MAIPYKSVSVIQVELVQGTRYRLRKNVDAKKALLLRDERGETEAIGKLVDEPWVFSRDCHWW
jgi:hypothetical protein